MDKLPRGLVFLLGVLIGVLLILGMQVFFMISGGK